MRVGNHNELEENKEILAGIGLTILIMAFLLYLYEYKAWLEGTRQLFAWILRPEVRYIPIPVNGTLYVVIGIFQILVLGTLSAHLLIPDEEHLLIRCLTAFGMGVGLVALLTAILALSQNLYNLWLNVAVIVLILILGTLEHKRWGRRWLVRFADYWKFRRTTMNRWSFLLVVGVAIVIFLIFYHAILSPIDHFDALIYHAGMAKVMFNYHGIPLVAGPSPGIQLSGNYPPLYPALGAFFFVHMNTTIVDIPLRAISPFMGLLTLFATYGLGRILLGHKNALLAILVIAATPFFILYSIHALNNMMAAYYLALAALHMALFFHRRQRLHLLVAGLSCGFAVSTTYLALYFIPAFILEILLFSQWSIRRWAVMFVPFLVGTVLTGAFWYTRNFIVLGNPIWPFAYSAFGGSFIDPIMEDQALQSVHNVGVYVSFGKEPDILDWIHLTFFGRAGFPALSVLTALGVAWAVASRSKNKGWVTPVLTIVPMASSFAFFPRYFVLILPFAAILSAQMLSYIFTSRRETVKFLAILALGTILVYPGITVAASGKMYHDVASWEPPQDFLWYLRNPGVDFRTAMKRIEGEGVEAWSWLNENLKADEKVATYESRIYYIKNGGVHHFFFLDGWEARPLFEMSEPEQMITYLKDNKVTYVLILGIVSVGIDALPLVRFLGTPYFPRIYQKGDGVIYNVGPISDPILDGEIPTQINYDGWTEARQVAGRLSRSIVEGDVRPRLFVATPDAVMVSMTYLDEGAGALRVDLYHPYAERWLFGLATINKTGTGEWRSYTFIVPQDPNRHFIELGLHASGTDFAISQIVVTKLNLTGYSSYLTPTRVVSNGTKPSSIMVYLPIMGGSEKFMVSSNSHGKNISIEIFEGIIQPDEVTRWWERHRIVAKSPELPSFGMTNPTLSWEAKPGIYTLVIVLWDEYEPDTKIDFSIAIDVDSSF